MDNTFLLREKVFFEEKVSKSHFSIENIDLKT